MEEPKEKESPSMDKAHLHVGNGEEYETQGLLIPAAQEFYKAAELFMACGNKAHDLGVKNTLKMLYNENNRRGKALQRKIQQMRDEGKDPSIPFGIKRTQSPQTMTGGLRVPRHDSPSRSFRPQDSAMLNSQRTLDDSYMVLGRNDPQDPFNRFWDVLEGMLDKLSQPVAFTSAPLVPPEAQVENGAVHAREGGSGDETGERNGLVQRANDLFASAIHATKPSGSSPIDQTQVLPPAEDEELEELPSDWEMGMEDSFFVVPSPASPSMKRLQTENSALKAELQLTKTRLTNVEHVIRNRQEQERQLRDSILMVRREAQRAISGSTLGSRQLSAQTLDAMFAGVLPQPPASGILQNPSPISQESHYVARIRELEEEIRLSRIENEKNRLTIARFRERWEKLKESAKRKRSARAAAEAEARAGSGGVNETIQEEPELEDVAG